jgi:hypothetical protein
VARASYVDPRVLDRYSSGWTIAEDIARAADRSEAGFAARQRIEKAVLDLISDETAGTVEKAS